MAEQSLVNQAAQDQFKQPFLSENQQALGKQAFQTAVQPLRASLDDQLTTTTESLAKKGAFFGGTGQEAFREQVLKPRAEQESQIAGKIATSLGQTALEQAHQTNEAAKNRQLQERLQKSGFEFKTEQQATQFGQEKELTDIGQQFQAEQTQLGREFTQEENQSLRDFNETQSQLDRDAQAGSQQAQFEQQDRQLRLQDEFAGNRLEAQQTFAAEQALLGRTFSSEETQKQQEFQTALQEGEFAFRGDQADIDRETNKQQQVLQLALSGNLKAEDVQGTISSLLGEGAVLTNDDEVALQRIATASGLSVEDYKNLRGAIGTSQGELILGEHDQDVVNDKGQTIYIDDEGNETTEASRASRFGDGVQLGTRIPFETKKETVPNINSFIDDPIAARKFALQMAQIQSNLQKDIATTQAQGGTVLCTELYHQGLLPIDIYMADALHSYKIDRRVIRGYHLWAIPVASMMKKSKLLTTILKPFIKSWAYHMAYKEGVVAYKSQVGAFIECIGVPFCYVLGCLVGEKRGVLNG